MAKFAVLFPGQGSQYVGMGKQVVQEHAVARQTLNEASESLGIDLYKLCTEGPLEELRLTTNAQPAILAVSIAMFRAYRELLGPNPVAFAGHSLGEFSALVAAGALNFAVALKLVRRRGELMQAAAGQGMGAMVAVGDVTVERVRNACREVTRGSAVVSNINAPEETVISGDAEAVREVAERLQRAGARVLPLNVSAPFHSPIMRPAAERFGRDLALCEFAEPTVPVFSNVTAAPYASAERMPGLLEQQMTEPVAWLSTLRALQGLGVDAALEVGPGTVLTKLWRRTLPQLPAFALDRPEDVRDVRARHSAMLSTPAKQAPSQSPAQVPASHLAASQLAASQLAASQATAPQASATTFQATVVTRCLATAVCIKNNSDDTELYQKRVVEPYRRIQKMQEELEARGAAPSVEQQRLALEMLKGTFIVKQTPVAEQLERFSNILNQFGLTTEFSQYLAAPEQG